MKNNKNKLILGIETSCDDTAVALVNSKKEILSNIVLNQYNKHFVFGGIVPEIAARAHLEMIREALEKSLNKALVSIDEIDLICATGGPGLIGGLIVGTTFAKTLAWSLQKPFVVVNHLEGHALTARLVYDVDYPYLLVLVSGGHTQIIAVISYGNYKRISSTLDDSAGETFDKAAKLLGLNQPGGVEIEKLSKYGDENVFKLPRPLLKSKNPNFSFSGLKTAFSRIINQIKLDDQIKCDLAASLQKSISDCIIDRTKLGIKKFKSMHILNEKLKLVVAGGVASNIKIRKDLDNLCKSENITFYVPPIQLCTDNGAMIAWAGYEKYLNRKDDISDFSFKARPRWPLDPSAYIYNPIMKKIGKKGVKA